MGITSKSTQLKDKISRQNVLGWKYRLTVSIYRGFLSHTRASISDFESKD